MNAIATNAWTAQDTAPMFPDGTVGGDGADEAYSARWTKDNGDGTFALITSYWYAVDMRDRSGASEGERYDEMYGEGAEVWDVENQIEYMVCTDLEDPGGTEVRCDYEYSEDVLDRFLPSVEAARAIAQSHCASTITNFVRDFHWNGTS